MSEFEAVYFDGVSARAHPVTARWADDGTLQLAGESVETMVYAWADLRVEERLGQTPRLIHLPGGRHCETADHAAVDAALEKLGRGRMAARLHRWETSWKAVVLGLIVVTVTVAVAIRYGLPAAAERIAYQLPIEVNEQIGRDALATLDHLAFKPSQLPPGRQDELRGRFRDFLNRTADPYPYRLEFRSAKELGANALAFPSGVIVVTDELVKLAKDDRELIAVLAHECGHIQRRHGLRTVMQNSAVVVLFALITGDIASVSTLGAALPTMLLESKFSRTFEAEADAYAVAALRRAGLDPGLLADILLRLEETRPKLGLDTRVLDYVSSHPPTPERIERIRAR